MTENKVIQPFETLDLDTCTLAESGVFIGYKGREEMIAIFTRMLADAHRSIHYFSGRFDPFLFDTELVRGRMEKILAAYPGSSIRTLVKDSQPLVQAGQRVLEVLRQYVPKTECRLRHGLPGDTEIAFITVDESGYLLLPNADHYNGTACFDAPGEVEKLTGIFNERWASATPDPDVQQIYI